jgi:hypothetical protein
MKPFIYALVDPIESRHVRYVGMAMKAGRPHQHARCARSTRTKATYQINWIRKLQAEGREPAVLVLEELSETSSRRFVGLIERMYIDSLRRIGHKLTNTHEGGYGGDPGDVYTPELRAKIGARHKGFRHSEETKALLRAQQLQVWLNPAHRAKASEISKAQMTPERRAEQSTTLKGRPGRVISLEEKEKLRALYKGRELPAEQRAKISESLKGNTSAKGAVRSPELRARISEAQRKRMADPIQHQKAVDQAAKMRAAKVSGNAARGGTAALC